MISATAAVAAGESPDDVVHEVTVDGADAGRRFDGVGGVSAGGSSRLLVDYPEPERSQILDYLFARGHGAELDILKVEIGGDVDSTVGAEASHERVEGSVRCDRGYEWWLMEQARSRNPDIAFYGLPWGAPGWFDGGFWSADRVEYLINWLECARDNGFDVDYIGAANESGYDRDIILQLAKALDANGFGDVQLVASDNHSPPNYWFLAPELQADQEFADAVDILGEHDVCVWRTLQRRCLISDAALELGKPLWDSENSTQDFQVGAEPLARAMNRHYIDARVTGNLNWSLLAAYYDNFPIGGTGLMTAERPWSGHYEVGPSIWVDAHTTQFTEPGWHYLDGASDYSAAGASYVSLRSGETDDYTTVIETLDANRPETFRFTLSGGLSTDPLRVWSTDLRTRTTDDDFIRGPELRAADGAFTFRTQPGHLYTLSTTSGQAKGDAKPHADSGEQLTLPFGENFENVGDDRLAMYFSDVHGAFETAPCSGGRDGTCYRQSVPRAPLSWHGTTLPPTTMVGDPRWWGDYAVGADVFLEKPGTVEVLGRVDSQQHNAAGYHLSLSHNGEWRVFSQDMRGRNRVLVAGTTEAPGTGAWHRLSLHFSGDRISAFLDGERLAQVRDDEHTTGQVGLRVGDWQAAEFDDVRVTPTRRAPVFVPQSQTTATATSEHAANDFGHAYTADLAVDDRLWSSWRSEYSPDAPLPQSITLDLGRTTTMRGLAYTPSVTGVTGAIAAYKVYASADGESFRQVAGGQWERTGATKTAPFDEAVAARYVRLQATEVYGCPASATVTGLSVSTTRLPALGHGAAPENPVPTFPNLVREDTMTATATSQQPGYEAGKAIDGSCASMWHSAWSPYQAPPQSVTLDLGATYDTTALIYTPRQDGNSNGVVTGYEIAVSADGQTFTPVAEGNWAGDDRVKYDEWAPTEARYVRFTAARGVNGYVAAAELDVAYAGITSGAQGSLGRSTTATSP